MRLRFLIAPLLVSLTAASAAHAQAAGDLAGLKRYVATQAYAQLLVEAAVAGEMQAAPDCRQPKPLDRAEFTIFAPPAFGAGPHPVAGMWRDRLKIDRCGAPAYQNVVFIARPDGPPQTALMLPGLTQALPQVQQTLLPKAAAVAQARARCGGEDVAVIDTKPAGTSRPVTRQADNGVPLDGQWRESWQFRACGKPVAVTVVFTADGVGGVFTEVK